MKTLIKVVAISTIIASPFSLAETNQVHLKLAKQFEEIKLDYDQQTSSYEEFNTKSDADKIYQRMLNSPTGSNDRAAKKMEVAKNMASKMKVEVKLIKKMRATLEKASGILINIVNNIEKNKISNNDGKDTEFKKMSFKRKIRGQVNLLNLASSLSDKEETSSNTAQTMAIIKMGTRKLKGMVGKSSLNISGLKKKVATIDYLRLRWKLQEDQLRDNADSLEVLIGSGTTEAVIQQIAEMGSMIDFNIDNGAGIRDQRIDSMLNEELSAGSSKNGYVADVSDWSENILAQLDNY